MSTVDSNHCKICLRPVPHASTDDFGSPFISSTYLSQQSHEEILERFKVLVTRYRRLKLDCFKPKSLLQRKGRWFQFELSENVQNHVCDQCVSTMASFCQLYDFWVSLHVEMNVCLEEIAKATKAQSTKQSRKKDSTGGRKGKRNKKARLMKPNQKRSCGEKGFRTAFLTKGLASGLIIWQP